MPSRVGTRTPPSEVGEGRATFLQGAFLVEILCIQTVNTVCPATGAMKPVPTGTRVGSIVHIAGHRCLCFLSRRGLSRETCFLKSPVPPLTSQQTSQAWSLFVSLRQLLSIFPLIKESRLGTGVSYRLPAGRHRLTAAPWPFPRCPLSSPGLLVRVFRGRKGDK